MGSDRGRSAAQLYRGHYIQGHKCDEKNRVMAIIRKDGTFRGENDGGEGSLGIRCRFLFDLF